MDFLDEILVNGTVNQSVIKQKAEAAGISTATLNREKQRCGRGSKRIAKGLTVFIDNMDGLSDWQHSEAR